MSARKTFRQFLNTTGSGGSISAGEFYLGARDAFEHYKYIWDTLRFRRGGLYNLWKKIPPQTYQQMAEDWAEANPSLALLKDQFWQPDVIEQLGFLVDSEGVVHLPK